MPHSSEPMRPVPVRPVPAAGPVRPEHEPARSNSANPRPTAEVSRCRPTRRTFLATTVGLAAIAARRSPIAGADQNAPAEPGQGIVDAHSHIWTRDVQKYPLANGNRVDDLQPGSFTAEELLAVARPLGVDRVVLIQHGEYHGFDNSYITDTIARHPRVFRGVAIVNSRDLNPAQTMRDLSEKGITGFRIRPRRSGDTRWLQEPGMRQMWRCGAERGLAMCPLIDPEFLPQIDRMCTQFPETPVVIDHFGRIGIDGEIRDADLQALCRLARHRKVRVKISAYYALGKKTPPYEDLIPMILRVLDAFGPERLMWASDCPYQLTPPHTYAASLNLIRSGIPALSRGDREWILRKTAEAAYFTT